MKIKIPDDFEEILNRSPLDFRWPRAGDRLLKKTDDWDGGAQISDESIAKHATMWTGYMSAGAGLIELCQMEGYQHNRHFLIYPILFNYRHGLELAMKWFLIMYQGQNPRVFVERHNLLKLWERCKALADQSDEAIKAVEQIVKDFHDLDKTNENFRYAWSRTTNQQKLPDCIIDLNNLRDVMEGVENFFVGLDGYIDAGA